MKGLILVTGSEGLVGSRFIDISKRKNFLHYPTKVEFDITNSEDVANLINSYNFSAVINFAAFTDVNLAEEERGDKDKSCWQVNVEGVKNLASAIKAHVERVHFIHISTNMVFSGAEGDPGPYTEDRLPEENSSKLTWYGYTKGQAENVIRNILGDRASIVRISYPVRASYDGKLDYLRRALQLFDEGKLYPLLTDQQISVTYIDELCELLDKIIIGNTRGNFHACSSNSISPYKLIGEVIKKTRNERADLQPIVLEEILSRKKLPSFRYPRFGTLSVEKTEKTLDFRFSTWEEIVEKLIAQGLGKI